MRVDLPAEVVGPVEAALAGGRAVELTYLGAVRDEVTERVVDPLGVVVVDGYGYLRGYCRSAGACACSGSTGSRRSPSASLPARTLEAPGEVEPMAVALGCDRPGGAGRRLAGLAMLDRHPVVAQVGAARRPGARRAAGGRLRLGPPARAGRPRATVVLREPGWLVGRRWLAHGPGGSCAARPEHCPRETPPE